MEKINLLKRKADLLQPPYHNPYAESCESFTHFSDKVNIHPMLLLIKETAKLRQVKEHSSQHKSHALFRLDASSSLEILE